MKALIDAEVKLTDEDLVRVCSTCKKIKCLDEFDKNKECSQGRTRQCKKCKAVKTRKWYSDNRARRQEESNQRNQKRRDECIDILGGKCQMCNKEYPRCCYDFHHIDPKTKVDAISNLLRRPSLLYEELKKCILLCANCHRIRHFEEGEVHESVD